MTRQKLRVFLQEWFCGCGRPEAAAKRLRDLLALHPLFDHRAEFEQLVPDAGLQELVLYTLDHFALTEHGGSIGGSWLTDTGTDVLEALNRETSDDFHALMEMSCSHGYAVESELQNCPECGPMNRLSGAGDYA